jgi:hypothetical protein
VRTYAHKGPIIQVGTGSALSGVTLQNLTVCGSSILTAGASPVGCPRAPTRCGEMVQNYKVEGNFVCEDLRVANVASTNPPSNPFQSGGPYGLTIDNVDLEDAAGHALSLWANVSGSMKVNDVYIHHSAINFSEVTGILYGTNGAQYHAKDCDNNPSFVDDPNLFFPRNLRIEHNTFNGNNTGAMGGSTIRWVGLRHNTFTNNYVNPQVGNGEGGTVQFDHCSDPVAIIDNDLIGPGNVTLTDGLELYSRNLTIDSNRISGYPLEGVTLNSVHTATVTNNTVTNNGIPYQRGGILVSTSESTSGPCGDPRDTQHVTISGNTSTGQPYGVHLHDHDRHSANTIHDVTVVNNTLAPNTLGAVGLDTIVVLDGYASPPNPATIPAAFNIGPRALTVKAISPITTRCSSNGNQPETFAFPASDASGTGSIMWIQGIFSISGRDSDGDLGPDTGAQGCHFLYYREQNLLYLDGPNGNSNWLTPSLVGAGGIDLSNGYCTIHAESGQVTTENFTISLKLGIEFPASASSSQKKHIYTITGDYQNQTSDTGVWKYWGWWSTL